MSKALQDSRDHWESRFLEACDTMCKIRKEIHDLQMREVILSPEYNVLSEAYEAVDKHIFAFHNPDRLTLMEILRDDGDVSTLNLTDKEIESESFPID